MRSEQLWIAVVVAPLFAMAAISSYAAAAGCYALTMNCFSINDANTPLTRNLLWFAAFLPFALPAYLPVAALGVFAIRRHSRAGWLAWLATGPLLFALSLHASCLLFAPAVLPERRVTPAAELDLAVAGAGYAWAVTGSLAVHWLESLRKPARARAWAAAAAEREHGTPT